MPLQHLNLGVTDAILVQRLGSWIEFIDYRPPYQSTLYACHVDLSNHGMVDHEIYSPRDTNLGTWICIEFSVGHFFLRF